ncbi:hypothetical protein MMC09_006944 [Bachmanniomyces sp. S44760]|nr:hypothetical protein [Bachmanniomyces sp. S44760]
MLGRLLHTAASTFTPFQQPRLQAPLESVTEESHTYNLIYPDPSTLHQTHQHALPFHDRQLPATADEAARFDDRGGLELAYPKNVRIVIAQDANAHYPHPQLLYDSKPSQVYVGDRLESEQQELRSPTSVSSSKVDAASRPLISPTRKQHGRSDSFFQSSSSFGTSPVSPRPAQTIGSFGRATASFEIGSSDMFAKETAQAKMIKQTREETDTLMGCMFGAPGLRLEPSTKLHVLPRSTPAPPHSSPGSPTIARPGSSRGLPRRRTPLTRSTSAADVPSDPGLGTETNGVQSATTSHQSIVITKLFSIGLPNTSPDDPDSTTKTARNYVDPFEQDRPSQQKSSFGEARKFNQKKVPIFAIAIVLKTPHNRITPRTPVSHSATVSPRYPMPRQSPVMGPLSELGVGNLVINNQPSSDLRGFGRYDSDLDQNLEQVLSQWKVILRALAELETVARRRLWELLECQSSIDVRIPVHLSPHKSPTKAKKPKQPTQQSVQVEPGCLQNCIEVQKESDLVGRRVIQSLKTRRVITGQDRWGAWREEARWVGRWAGGRDQNFFFFNILTAFLGCHTAWLESSGMLWHRQHSSSQKKAESLLRQRTVIISSDKMASRRLIFLLSAFLPSTRVLPSIESLQWSSCHNSLHSENSSLCLARHQSLRRNINRPNLLHVQDQAEFYGHKRASSIARSETLPTTPTDTLEHIRSRRISDVRSIRSATLPIVANEVPTRKASISTELVDSAVPVPHFSTSRTGLTAKAANARVNGSREKSASAALSHTLQRSESAGDSNISGSNGRWGSMLSGFWSVRQGSSTEDSDALGSSHEGLGIFGLDKDSPQRQRSGKLPHMAEDSVPTGAAVARQHEDPASPTTVRPLSNQAGSHAQNNPISAEAVNITSTPVRYKVDENDGAIDIELPVSSPVANSIASSMSSYRFGNTASSSFNEHYTPYGRPISPELFSKARLDSVFDVGGWFSSYQPDFTLQAVQPYETLEDDIRKSMRAEADIAALPDAMESKILQEAKNGDVDEKVGRKQPTRWTEICSTLIADAKTFSVKRLRLRRRARTTSPPTTLEMPNSQLTDRPPPYEESILSEAIMDMDPILIDAVERILAQSGRSSKVHSRAPSRAPSPTPSRPIGAKNKKIDPRDSSTCGNGNGTGNGKAKGREKHAHQDDQYEAIPRDRCEEVVMTALSEVVRSVAAEHLHRSHGTSSSARNEDGIQHQEEDAEKSGKRDEQGTSGSRSETYPDSTLREGVRKWLLDVEGAWFRDIRN